MSSVEETLQNYGQLFEIETGGNVLIAPRNIAAAVVGDALSIDFFYYDTVLYLKDMGAIGMIRSRKDQDLRSNSVMNMNYGSSAEDMYGIASDYLLDAWRSGTVPIGDSDLILEGGEG